MEEILACRVCLATDVKLFDVFANKLVSAYELITGVQISERDGLPHKACSYCAVALRKHAAFTERCLSAQELLTYLIKREKITTDILRQVDRSNYPSQPQLTIESVYSSATDQIKEEDAIDYNDDDLAIDNDHVDIDNDIKSEASDEEPLSKKIERKNGDYEQPVIKEEFEVPEIDLMFLSKEEQMEELKKRMGSLNYLNSLYKCEYCYKGFMTDVTYKNHMLRHDPKAGAFMCEICATYCASARALKGHLATSHERKYVCRLCSYVTKSGSRAREHGRWHAGHTYSCALCGATFTKSTSYLTHVRLRHPSRHCCAACGDSFVGENGLNLHLKKAHRLQEQGISCTQCGAKFRSEDALARHRELNHCDTTNRPCSQCGEGYPSEQQLGEHVGLAHGSDNTKCQECDKTFSSERSYAIHHQRIHLGLRLKRHAKRRDLAASKVVCEHCGKACHSKANLVHHQRTHTGERPYACAQCPKNFTNLQLLQVHTRTHTGERPYKCSVCAKGFVHKAGLNRHARVHTGEKPYACSHCGKAFSQSNSMKLHVRTVHLKLPAPYRPRKNHLAVT